MSRIASLLQEKFILIASLPENRVDLAKAAEAGGADAMKVHCNVAHFASGTTFGSFEQERPVFEQILSAIKVPLGLVPGDDKTCCSADEMRVARGLGFDFWDIFWHHCPLYLFDVEDMGRMMAVDSSFTSERVGFLSRRIDLVEGSVIPQSGYRQPVRAADLTVYQQLCMAAECPVAIPTQRAVRPDEVWHLERSGARGVVIGAVVTGHDAKEFEQTTRRFREAIDRL
ncbi:MAG TPA: hypothetical protein VGO93_27850 [Candidatus Xenobia bacterium]|jgi:hypothetical protein